MIPNIDRHSLKMLSWFLFLMIYLCFVPNQIHAQTLPAYRTGWHWPTNASENNRWISRGRYENSALHDAIDITAGNEVRASRDGIVEYVFKGCSNVNGYGEGRTCTVNNCASKDSFPYCGYCNAGSGNGVVLRHEIDGETYYSAYSHMVENSIPNDLVKGTAVKAGDKLGIMGASGMAAGVHLHFNIYSDYSNNISINVNPVDISNKVKISTTDTSGLMQKNGYVYDINGINYVTGEMNYATKELSVLPNEIDFGAQYIGEEIPFRRLITITNLGTIDIELNTDVQSEYFIVESFSKEKLSSGESATAAVLFRVGMPAGTYEEIVNIETIDDHLQPVVSIPLKLKIQHVLIEVPLNPLCEYCQSDNTEVMSFMMIHDAVYNGDSTHTVDGSYCYLVNCLNCHEEYQKTLNRSKISFVCGYDDQGICYTCGHTYLACAHGKENYVKTGYEIEDYTPVFKDENYHFLPGTFFWCYECSICGAEAREAYASTREEEHYHYADRMCACGYKVGCETHEFVDGVCSICGRPDLHSLNATLTLPANIKSIKMEAFTGSAAEAIIVPDGCLTIGERAFAQCENLKCIVLPDSLTEIAEDAFEGCLDLAIFAPQNSIAHVYAREHGYMWYEE